MTIIKVFGSMILFLLLVGACNNSDDKTKAIETKKENLDELKAFEENECNCTRDDANRLASKIVRDFRLSQNEVESNYARVLRLEKLEKRPNCSWVATFEISWPFGNTDGMHPSESIIKRFICDGVEIYTQ